MPVMPAGDLLTAKLPAEDQRREDHHLRDRVMALDVGGWVRLGQAGALGLCQRFRIGQAVSHLGQDVRWRWH